MGDGSDGICSGGLWGLFIGDALAMPVHWYYDRRALQRDYGRLAGYQDPRHPHPDSEMGTYGGVPTETGADIFQGQEADWGRPGLHYHHRLRAGDNTLNLRLCGLLLDSLRECAAYRPEDYLARLVAFMTTPGSHDDTYVDAYLRGFFRNRARGRPLGACGVPEKHLSGLIGLVPVALFHRRDPAAARRDGLTHMRLTHTGPVMEAAADLFLDLLEALLAGRGLPEALEDLHRRKPSALLAASLETGLELSDEEAADRRLGTGCFIPEALPLLLYLARKYHDRPADGLVANTCLGGNNAARGALLGALLGLANGLEAFPRHWITGLRRPPDDAVVCREAAADQPWRRPAAPAPGGTAPRKGDGPCCASPSPS